KTCAAAGADARGRTAVSIADTGCGIPPDRQETVFSDFVTTKRHGLGLGLALVKRVVDQHGAEIKLASEVGRGTTFEILFSAASRAPDLG
ncbi:MAG: ATP-binding protein, partial [bacterium]